MIQSDAHPKLGHFSLQDAFFRYFFRVIFLCSLFVVFFQFWTGFGGVLERFWEAKTYQKSRFLWCLGYAFAGIDFSQILFDF